MILVTWVGISFLEMGWYLWSQVPSEDGYVQGMGISMGKYVLGGYVQEWVCLGWVCPGAGMSRWWLSPRGDYVRRGLVFLG